MAHDADLNSDYDYDEEAEWQELQRIMEEQDALDREEEEHLYGSLEELRFLKRFDDAVYLEPNIKPLDEDEQ